MDGLHKHPSGEDITVPAESVVPEQPLSWEKAARLQVLLSAALWGVIIAVVAAL